MKRTHLPLNGLRVLDAAARHLSFTRAADELAVTPAAVGQQIRALEDTLGVVLFRRTAKGLELTPEAESGLDALRDGFLQFEEAVRAMQSQQSSKVLTIAAPRDFTAKWLAPSLAAYAQSDGELRFHLIAADGDIDFTEANLDLAVIWSIDSGSHDGMKLAEGAMVSVGEGPHIAWPGDPAEAGSATLTVADAGLALDAALAGFGRAKVPALLAGIEGGEPTDRTYWLVAPTPQWRQKKVRDIVSALTGQN
jgi:LysR family glycine cleavage system transcriptional activator